MDAQELQDPEKVSAIWVNLNSTVNRMNIAKSSMVGMRPKDTIKVDIVELDKSEPYPEENVPHHLKVVYIDI